MSIENLSPQVILKIANELVELSTQPIEDIQIISNEDDITDIQALINGPIGTPYEKGIFRVKVCLGSDFPQSPPKAMFLTKIFHPNVSKNGEICVNTLKKDWKQDLGIKHLLITIKCLLIVPNAESALNEEAGRLLLECYDEYAKHAKLMTIVHATPKTNVISTLSSPSSNSHTTNNTSCSLKKRSNVSNKPLVKSTSKVVDIKKKGLKRL
eukprot:TRINITY_DN645_c0_g1_i3.p1 TRINITY_DN645_c0_g1~~TRINITY_DN645_c0_g1_i3.p1  ORF type:complete len:211 (+),score=62.38 TRINITY_DN645_c0_g1_i3:168-800(+)